MCNVYEREREKGSEGVCDSLPFILTPSVVVFDVIIPGSFSTHRNRMGMMIPALVNIGLHR